MIHLKSGLKVSLIKLIKKNLKSCSPLIILKSDKKIKEKKMKKNRLTILGYLAYFGTGSQLSTIEAHYSKTVQYVLVEFLAFIIINHKNITLLKLRFSRTSWKSFLFSRKGYPKTTMTLMSTLRILTVCWPNLLETQ